MSLSDVGLL